MDIDVLRRCNCGTPTLSSQAAVLAGSLAAAMLGRAGIDAVLVDPHPVYPPDFRCEKLDSVQLRTLQLTGLADAVMSRFDTRSGMRGWRAWAASWTSCRAYRNEAFFTTRWSTPCVRKFRTAPNSSTPRSPSISRPARSGRPSGCRTATRFSARLVVLATGLNIGLRQKLGIDREVISPSHSISIGFDVQPADRPDVPLHRR